MMDLLGSLIIACSMYSKIPMPQVAWTKERMRFAMCFFPVVGVIQAVVLYGAVKLAWNLELWVLYGIGGVVVPLLVNGGIHMDGFLDVIDARASYGEKEKKLEILKDPHAGAFAIIGCVVYVLVYLGIFLYLPVAYLPAFGGVYVLTRGLSGLSVVIFPKAKASGLATSFSDEAQKQVTVAVMLLFIAVSLCYMVWTAGMIAGIGCGISACVVYGYYYRMSVREFGGITGDLAGYFLQVCELVLLIVLTAAARL